MCIDSIYPFEEETRLSLLTLKSIYMRNTKSLEVWHPELIQCAEHRQCCSYLLELLL